jgi:hypothetical protein
MIRKAYRRIPNRLVKKKKSSAAPTMVVKRYGRITSMARPEEA